MKKILFLIDNEYDNMYGEMRNLLNVFIKY